MMLPVVHTIQRAFTYYNHTVKTYIGPASRLNWTNNSKTFPDIFIWVGMCEEHRVPWDKLPKHTKKIFYQTEGLIKCNQFDSLTKVDEVWDYSFANVAKCRKNINMKYFPPGCLDVVPAIGDTTIPKIIHRPSYFLGGVHLRSSNCKKELKNVKAIRNIWNFHDFLKLNAFIFVNFHKNCGQKDAFEAFRASLVLSSGGVLISEHSHARDEQEFKEFVTFVNTTTVYSETKKINVFNTVKRRHAFCEKFAPEKLLLNSESHVLQTTQKNSR